MKVNRKFALAPILIATVGILLLSIIEPGTGLASSMPATKGIDLRDQLKGSEISVRNQGSRNTCSVFATTFLIEFETAKASNQKGLDLSEDYLNAVTDMVTNVPDDGDFFNNILNGYLKFGTVSQTDFPNTA